MLMDVGSNTRVSTSVEDGKPICQPKDNGPVSFGFLLTKAGFVT